MSFDNVSLGFTGVSRFSGQRGRTADGMSRSGVRYPSPFFDIGHTYLPPSIKQMLKWCRYYYLVNPLINAVIHKMSEYPVTEIVIDEKNTNIKEKWEVMLGTQLRYRPFQIECGLDYYTYGMCVVTMHFPFTKYLICSNCGHKEKATKCYYKWRNLDYIIHCNKCEHDGPAKVQDYYERNVRGIRLERWNPEYVNVEPGFGTQDATYTFEIPIQTRSDIMIGKRTVLDTIPDTFIEAIKRNKFIRFAPENIFVLKRPIIAQKDRGWGMPLIFPVLKDTFYMQILRKAQEMIAQEHIVPLRVLFPQANSGTSDPYSTINLGSWRSTIEAELSKWRYDQNYVPILPLPIGHQEVGGDGKALGLYQEMEIWSRQIVAGMGVPEEFIFGGMQYSGSNVSMRILENAFIGYRQDHEVMLNEFVIKRIAHFMGWPTVKAHMRKFKMADDLQRMGFYFQLNQAQKISDETLLQECDQDPGVEEERKQKELDRTLAYQRKMQLAQAEIQGEMQIVQTKYTIQAGKMQQEQMAQMGGVPPGAEGAPDGAGGPEGDPSGGAAAGMPGMQGQPTPGSGAEGEMLDGQSVDPSMPQGSTVSPQNAQGAPQDGIPTAAQSPLTMGTQGGGFNLLYLAKRAANQLKKLDPLTKNVELTKLKTGNPQLYMLVMQMMNDQLGSQNNPLDPMQSPLPQQKPSRSKTPVGA